MAEDRFAAISDIHGNIFALNAVLDDLANRGIRGFVNLGDHLYGPIDPVATAERLMALGATSIRGNCDRLLYEPESAAVAGSTIESNRKLLADRHRQWLEQMPQTLRFRQDVLLCHGTPWADDLYLLEEVGSSSVRLRSPQDLSGELAGLDAGLILCGHSHTPRAVQVSPALLVVNVGSVGLPAYTDENPPHAMEAGSPHARYAILTRNGPGWALEQIAVRYDWESAATMADGNERPDWAHWLRTGRA
jgi:predicted phosphodiesterase